MNNIVIKSNTNTYFIKYPINAHCEAEEILGFPITQLGDGNTGISTFRTLLYVGLKYSGNPVSMDQVGDIMGEVINDKGWDYLSNQISEGIQKSLNQQTNQNFKQNHNQKKSR
ncbi:hypothetical protein M3936_03680 [Sutcliffiella horikoshii]|uniref:hypothetical protein n=1 Tax=Sutcliffiella horikoshii TaxID=79883 RepID=UPI0020424644|nr:hypothetical protein [Sutcliffiella horikoshii]MCM3616677.1 hypothetical protein [Sutcliffiella horikoshii]